MSKARPRDRRGRRSRGAAALVGSCLPGGPRAALSLRRASSVRVRSVLCASQHLLVLRLAAVCEVFPFFHVPRALLGDPFGNLLGV